MSGRIQVQGSSANVTHTINEDERTEFTRHINAVLAGDPDIGNRLPFPTDTFEMFDECKDGLVLAKLINDSVPDTIDERVLNRPGKKIKTLNAFHMTENNNIVINSAKGIGCSVVNIGSGDIIEVREHLILGLIWQVIRRGLLGKIDIKLHPELYRLLEDDETLEQFLRLPPEQILLRWFNYHLKNAKWNRTYGSHPYRHAMLTVTQSPEFLPRRQRWRELHHPPQSAETRCLQPLSPSDTRPSPTSRASPRQRG